MSLFRWPIKFSLRVDLVTCTELWLAFQVEDMAMVKSEVGHSPSASTKQTLAHPEDSFARIEE